jgi:hypothetical protein
VLALYSFVPGKPKSNNIKLIKMKKQLLFIALALIATIITIIFVEKNTSTESVTVNTVNENVSLVVYKSADYTSTAYNNASAQLHVTIEKVNPAGENTIVWDKTFDAKYLSQYPSVEDAIKQNVEINNIRAKNEYLVVKYDIIYNSQGSELQMQNNVIIKDDSSGNISISI